MSFLDPWNIAFYYIVKVLNYVEMLPLSPSWEWCNPGQRKRKNLWPKSELFPILWVLDYFVHFVPSRSGRWARWGIKAICLHLFTYQKLSKKYCCKKDCSLGIIHKGKQIIISISSCCKSYPSCSMKTIPLNLLRLQGNNSNRFKCLCIYSK